MNEGQLSIDDAFELAFEHHRAGRLPEAKALYAKILDSAPNHPDALHFLGVAALQEGDPERAVTLIERATNKAPNVAPYFSNLGEAYRALNKLDAAAAAYRRALAINPNFAMAHNNLANVLADIGRVGEALTHYDRAIALEPRDPEARLNRADALIQLGRTSEAAEAYRQLANSVPLFAPLWSRLAAACEVEGADQEAEDAFVRALELDPNDGDAQSGLERVRWKRADAFMRSGDAASDGERWRDAVSAYEQTLSLSPYKAAAHYRLGCAWRALGETENAIAAFEQAVQVQPFFEDAHAALGELLLKRTGGALSSSNAPEARRPAMLTATAIAHHCAGRYAQAEHAATQAAALLRERLAADGDDNEAWTLMGLALRAISDTHLAERLLRDHLKALHL